MGSIPVATPSRARRRWGVRAAIVALGLAAAIASAVVLVISFSWPESGGVREHAVIEAGEVSDLAPMEPVLVPEGRFYLVKLESGEIIALSRYDPHRGCAIAWRPDFEYARRRGWFRDPCGGSTYDVTGNIAFGPSPRSMDRYPVLADGGAIRVNTAYRICGEGFAPPGDGCRRTPPAGWPDPLD